LLVNLCSKNRRVNNKRVNNANEAKNEAIVVATLDLFRASSDINFTSYEGRSGLISVVSTRSSASPHLRSGFQRFLTTNRILWPNLQLCQTPNADQTSTTLRAHHPVSPGRALEPLENKILQKSKIKN
jgi:hypothetical protein